MKKFKYRAKSADGQLVAGKVEARDENQAISLLRQRQLTIISLYLDEKNPRVIKFIPFARKTSFTEVVNFTRQLSTMITAGLSLTEALSLLEAQVSPAFYNVLSDIRRRLEGGNNLGSALKNHPKIFSKTYVASVRAGETAGALDKVLARLATNLEKQRDFLGKVKGAMMYPAIVLIGMVLVSAAMMIFVLPQMMGFYENFDVELPTPTRILMAVSNFAASFWWLGALLIGALVYFFKASQKTSVGRRQCARFIFKLPIIGNVSKKVILTEFTRTLSLLIETGIPIIESLDIVGEAAGNEIYKTDIARAAKKVEKGFPLAAALAESEYFPPIVTQMVSVGEETGKMDEVLIKLSHYFEAESEQAIKGLTTAIEPLIIILLGIGVGFLVIAVIMPIYNLTSQF